VGIFLRYANDKVFARDRAGSTHGTAYIKGFFESTTPDSILEDTLGI